MVRHRGRHTVHHFYDTNMRCAMTNRQPHPRHCLGCWSPFCPVMFRKCFIPPNQSRLFIFIAHTRAAYSAWMDAAPDVATGSGCCFQFVITLFYFLYSFVFVLTLNTSLPALRGRRRAYVLTAHYRQMSERGSQI